MRTVSSIVSTTGVRSGCSGIEELTDEHWKCINFLQDYYKKNGIAPMVRVFSKVTGYKLKHIYELFPSGPGKGACKMAGLPKPTEHKRDFTEK